MHRLALFSSRPTDDPLALITTYHDSWNKVVVLTDLAHVFRFLSSRVFIFVIGPDKKEFAVHGSILAKVSRPLNILLTGGMKEAQQGRVEWPDVDVPTFGHFMQWVYTQTYDPPEPAKIATTEPEQSLPGLSAFTFVIKEPVMGLPRHCSKCHGTVLQAYSASCVSCKTQITVYLCKDRTCRFMSPSFCQNCEETRCDGCQEIGRVHGPDTTKICRECRSEVNCRLCEDCKVQNEYHANCAKCSNDPTHKASAARKQQLIEKFKSKIYPESLSAPTKGFEARKNKDSSEDYSSVFLCHARLYVLGDTYLIPELQKLAIHRLHATLKEFVLYPSRLQDVIMLVKYVFENTRPDDEICDMLSLYCACIRKSLDDEEHGGLELLMIEAPNFGLRLVRQME